MTYQLILTEKPDAAKKIAESLADGKPIKKNIEGVSYYEITHGNTDIVVASAVGHLYTVTEKEKKKGWVYPIFDVAWEQSSKVNKASKFTSKYVAALKKLSKEANSFIVATDFDIEGEVIGYTAMVYACKQKDAQRMKFSTLTKDELRESYDHRRKTLEWGQVHAGLTRHELDWYYGINLSRALSLAVRSAGMFKILSSGRVQGPALKTLTDREKEIHAFKPEPYWEVQLLGVVDTGDIEAWHVDGKIVEKKRADEIIKKTRGKNGVVTKTEKTQFQQAPPHPFDLTSLQVECYRVHRIQPKETLEIAQELYIGGLISYPRTSSQQLPESIGYKKILQGLQKNSLFGLLANKVLGFSHLKPHNGKKTDPAHPAIYPTGNLGRLEDRKLKVYDLITKRFLATFGIPAVRETMSLIVAVNGEEFIAKGTRTIEKNWHELYAPYVQLEEQELPAVKEKDPVTVKEINCLDKETQPPKRYTPASIIKELEKRNLGTKATRASIVDTLFDRGYVTGQPIQVTELGMKTVETLEKYCPSILDEALTRQFEEEMDEIYNGKKEGKEVLAKAQEVLTTTLKVFKAKEKDIGAGLIESHREAETIANTVGKCPKCAGTLMIKKGKFGKFVACSKYPECTVTFKLPAMGLIKPTDKTCEVCSHPLIKVIRKGKQPQEICLNTACTSKLPEGVAAKDIVNMEKEGKTCEKCKKPMVLRHSVYGKFWGCSGFPKCRNLVKI